MFKKLFVLAILAFALTACEKPAQELKQPPEVAVDTTALDQPIEDVPPATMPPLGQPVIMPEPDPTLGGTADDVSDFQVADSEEAKRDAQKLSALIAAGNNTFAPGMFFDPSRRALERYPIFADFTCEFAKDDSARCYMGAHTPVSVQEVASDLPFISNGAIDADTGEILCGNGICTDADGKPFGRIQPEMQKFMAKNYRHFGNGQFSTMP